MRWAPLALTILLATPACSFPRVVHDLHYDAPEPELGRPDWVRGTARVGAWVGGLCGAIASVVVLPVTWPITLLADEPLGYSKDEFMFGPVSGGASLGHFLLGAPTDMLHFMFYRAWTDDRPEGGYSFTPMAPPVGPGTETRPAGTVEAEATGQTEPGDASR